MLTSLFNKYHTNKSLKEIMQTPELKLQFINFCIEEHSYENFAFLDILEKYKLSKHYLHKLYEEIVHLYLEENSIYQLNIPAEVLNKVKSLPVNINTFDLIEKEVGTLVKLDILPRFNRDIKNNIDKHGSNAKIIIEDRKSSLPIIFK